MIKEALEYLSQLTAQAAKVQDLPSDYLTSRSFVGGQIDEFRKLEPPRRHGASTLADLIALANRFGSLEDGSCAPVVWYNETAVTLVIDDEGHRVHKATMTLEHSDVFKVLVALRKDPHAAWRKQADFIRLLRIDLCGTLPDYMLLDKVRKLKIGTTETTEIQRRAESMGASINALVDKDTDPPDEVALEVPIYRNPGEREPLTVGCTVELDVKAPAPFRLLPRPDEIERVQILAMQDLATRLRGGLNKSIPCYYGSP